MSRRISQAELSSLLAARADMPIAEAERFVTQFFTVLGNGLVHDKLVKVRGLGTFKVIDVSSRTSVNVNTGERYEIASHAKVSFTPDASLRDTINSPFASFETVVINEGTDLSKLEAITQEMPVEETPVPEEAPVIEAVPAVEEEPTVDDTPATETTETAEPAETVQDSQEEQTAPADSTSGEQEEPEQQEGQEEPATEQPIQEQETEEDMEKKDTTQTTEATNVAQNANIAQKQSKWKQFAPYCATGIIMLIIGYCIGYYLHPIPAPSFISEEESAIILAYRQHQQAEADRKAQIQQQQEALDKHLKEEATKQARVEQTCKNILAEESSSNTKQAKTNGKSSRRMPSEALAYPQIEDGEYYIVGIRDTVIVKPGMTLLNMAIKYYKDKDLYVYICKLSGVDDPNRVHPDQKLLIPELRKKE